jgi:glycosyltransferase involved in cell wall biosynthesis
VEAWTWLLARELARLGHEVTIFGCGGSVAECDVVATLPGPYGAPGSFDDWQLCEWVNLCKAVEEAKRFDIIHTQAYLWGITLERFTRTAMVHTLHIVPDSNSAGLWRSHPHGRVTALSPRQWADYPELKPTAVIPHGVDVAQFTFQAEPSDYLLYFGRFTPGKGPIQAIRAARELGLRLILAGPANAYFRENVKPLIDGKLVEYVGHARPTERDQLLGGARALLYPIQYPEAFGLVLVEAMLCGTPVAAMNFGAVPEIVEHGVSGFISENAEEYPKSILRCFELERGLIRKRAEERFSAGGMAEGYAGVYASIAGNQP